MDHFGKIWEQYWGWKLTKKLNHFENFQKCFEMPGMRGNCCKLINNTKKTSYLLGEDIIYEQIKQMANKQQRAFLIFVKDIVMISVEKIFWLRPFTAIIMGHQILESN